MFAFYLGVASFVGRLEHFSEGVLCDYLKHQGVDLLRSTSGLVLLLASIAFEDPIRDIC